MSFRRMRHTKAREWQGCDIAYDFSNPATLYDATSGGSLVGSGAAIARAEDVSGNGNHMTQSSSTLRPLRIVAAQRGLDAARFDGTNDYMTAGDIADIGLGTFELAIVFKRSGGSTAVQGYLAKSLYGDGGGRFYLAYETTDSVGSDLGTSQPVYTGSAPTTWQVLHGWHLRSASNVAQQFVSRNAATPTSGSAFAANTATNYDTNYLVLLGAYNDPGGTAPQNGSYFNGDFGEAVKWNNALGSMARRRFDHSRARKWGIAT